AEVGEGAHPGRRGARREQVPRRPPVGAAAAQGDRPGLRGAVHELPLTQLRTSSRRPVPRAQSSLSGLSAEVAESWLTGELAETAEAADAAEVALSWLTVFAERGCEPWWTRVGAFETRSFGESADT